MSPTNGRRAPLLGAISGLVLLQMSMATAQEFQCPEGHVVMEFAGEIPDGFFENSTAFNVSVTSSSAAADLDDDTDKDRFELFQSWPNAASMEPLCVPADMCLTVNIQINHEPYGSTHLPNDFAIVYDDATFSLLGPFPPDNFEAKERIDYYMEVGANCLVTCDEDQLLLEIEAATGRTYMFDWQVIDESTNEVIRACASHRHDTDQRGCYWSSDSWYRDRVCVPKSGCHRFVTGRGADDSRTILQVTFDGEIVLHSDYFAAESLRLEHQESPSSCWRNSSACQSEADPSLVEMEIFVAEKWATGINSSLTWYANYYDSEQMIYNQGTADFTGRRLQYNRMCIPNCAMFSYDFVSDWFFPEHQFQVQVDGIIFAEGNKDSRLCFKRPKSSYIVGSSCQASRYCEEEGQSLVQVGMDYHPQFPLIPDLTVEWWTIAYASSLKEKEFKGDESYRQLECEDLGIGFPLWSNNVGTPVLQPGKHYRRNFCLSDWYFQDGSNTGCTVLDMHLEDEHAPAHSYHVSVNGVVFGDRIDCSQKVSLGYDVLCHWLNVVDNPTPSILTPLNGNCKVKGIPGFIAGGTALGVLMIAGLCFYTMRRRAISSKESNDMGLETACKVNGTSPAPGAIEASVTHGTTPTMVAMSDVVAIPMPNRERSNDPVPPGHELENRTTPQTSVDIESDQVPDGTDIVHAVAGSDQEDVA